MKWHLEYTKNSSSVYGDDDYIMTNVVTGDTRGLQWGINEIGGFGFFIHLPTVSKISESEKEGTRSEMS